MVVTFLRFVMEVGDEPCRHAVLPHQPGARGGCDGQRVLVKQIDLQDQPVHGMPWLLCCSVPARQLRAEFADAAACAGQQHGWG